MYTVTFLLAELYWTKAGERVFSLNIQVSYSFASPTGILCDCAA